MKNTKVKAHSRSTKGKGNTSVRSHSRTTKNKKGVWVSGDENMGALSAPAGRNQLKARNKKSKLKNNTLMGRINLRGGIEQANNDDWQAYDRKHPMAGNGNKSKRRLGVSVKDTRPKGKRGTKK